eukprot:6603483-Alexandrium_andersonii.AAC.1
MWMRVVSIAVLSSLPAVSLRAGLPFCRRQRRPACFGSGLSPGRLLPGPGQFRRCHRESFSWVQLCWR